MKARARSGYTLAQVADHLEIDGSTLSRFESGVYRIRRVYIKELLDFYGISKKRERDILMQLSKDTWREDWWEGDTSDLEMGFLDFTWLEARAAHIRTFSPLLIHGLLQTHGFAEAVTRYDLGHDTPDDTAVRMVELRMVRQRILHNDKPTKLSVILEEPALRRLVGGPTVMHDQLKQLATMSKQSHVEIRVLTCDVAEWDAGYKGPFTYFEMPDPYPEVAYVETLAGQTFLEEDLKVDKFRTTYDELHTAALGPEKSIRLIQDIAKDLE